MQSIRGPPANFFNRNACYLEHAKASSRRRRRKQQIVLPRHAGSVDVINNYNVVIYTCQRVRASKDIP